MTFVDIMKASHMRLKQGISTGPTGLILFIKLALKIYNTGIFIIIITDCCLCYYSMYVCLLALSVCLCKDT